MRPFAFLLLLAGCVPIESTMIPINIEAKTFRVELPGASVDGSHPAGPLNPLDGVVLPVCPQGYTTLEMTRSWNPLNGRIYTYEIQCRQAGRWGLLSLGESTMG